MTFAWEAALILLPLAAALLTFLWPRSAPATGWSMAVLLPGLATGLLWRTGHGPWRHLLGGWGAPLGIELWVDGLSALLVAVTALVGALTTLYSLAYFVPPAGEEKGRQFFWPLWFLLWGGLNTLFFSADVFNLYVALELVTLAAVALIALAGTPFALGAALRYLLAAMFGSLCYLLGVALLYGQGGALDLRTLAGAASGGGVAVGTAMVLVSVGLLLKTALFPLHFWLPSAHASAPAPVSAVLSGLVVKASFYLLLRFWFEVFPPAAAAAQLLGVLGGAAIAWGSLQALRQTRLKMLIAYSTVAQLGYLFLLFPLAPAAGASAWGGGLLFALSHACAKAAMFLAAGTILHAAGHDRIADFGRLPRSLKFSLLVVALGGVNLIGLPPSGGEAAKKMLLDAAWAGGQWWWVLVVYAGTLLTALYLLRTLLPAFRSQAPLPLRHPPAGLLQWSALLLAIVALLLGPLADYPLRLLEIGRPFIAAASRIDSFPESTLSFLPPGCR